MNLANTYEQARQMVIDQDGAAYPGGALAQMELVPGYQRAQNRLLPYIRGINEAHLIMLAERGIVSKADAAVIMQAIEAIDYESYKGRAYSGAYEDLYFEMEADIIGRTGGIGGNLHLARSRNDMCVAWSRMAVRDDILALMDGLVCFQNTVLLFAQAHRDTLYAIHTHTQHAQPGLLGHYFLGVVDVLERNIARLGQAYAGANMSPMGAAAVTTSGFPISRERVAELVGFDRVIENAYDAIGNCDYFTATASAIGLCALDMGRVVTDLVLWATEEEKTIRVADGYISTSSIMPQKRNPIALEHLRASLSVVKGLCDTVVSGFFKSPYGDISDYEDVEQPMDQAVDLMKKNLRLFNAVMATLDVDRALLKARVEDSFCVVTELADELVRRCRIPFRQAHHFVAELVKKADRLGYNLKALTQEFFAQTYLEQFGAPFTGDFAPIARSLDPRHFVTVRQATGGTGPRAMDDMIRSGAAKVARNRAWLDQKLDALSAADARRMASVRAIIGGRA